MRGRRVYRLSRGGELLHRGFCGVAGNVKAAPLNEMAELKREHYVRLLLDNLLSFGALGSCPTQEQGARLEELGSRKRTVKRLARIRVMLLLSSCGQVFCAMHSMQMRLVVGRKR